MIVRRSHGAGMTSDQPKDTCHGLRSVALPCVELNILCYSTYQNTLPHNCATKLFIPTQRITKRALSCRGRCRAGIHASCSLVEVQ